MREIRYVIDLYRNPRYKHFGLSFGTRVRNYADLILLMSLTGEGLVFTSDLIQSAYRQRRVYGVTMNETINRLIEEIQSGHNPRFLAMMYETIPNVWVDEMETP